MKLKKLLKGCLNTVDSIHILEVNTDKFSKCISERELIKWSIVEGSDAWIYLNIKVK